MASTIDTCNLALAHLGAQSTIASIDPPEGSAYAAHCARFLPVAQETLLAAHDWGFARRSVALALVGTPPAGWTYQYARPSDCVRARAVVTAEDGTLQPFEQAGPSGARTILTDVEDAVLLYTARVDDYTLWDHGAAVALSYLLASYLAFPVTRDAKVRVAMERAYMDELGKATAGEANEGRQDRTRYTPAHIQARS